MLATIGTNFEMCGPPYCLLNIDPPTINKPLNYAFLPKALTPFLIIPHAIQSQRVAANER